MIPVLVSKGHHHLSAISHLNEHNRWLRVKIHFISRDVVSSKAKETRCIPPTLSIGGCGERAVQVIYSFVQSVSMGYIPTLDGCLVSFSSLIFTVNKQNDYSRENQVAWPLGSICKSFVFSRNLSEGSRKGERNNDKDGGRDMGRESRGKREGEGRNEHSGYILKYVLTGLSVLLEFKAYQR